MRLTFRVLWFDDSGEFFESHSLEIDGLKQEIFSWGFSPDIELVTTPEEFLNYRPFKEFDLIVVDRNLDTYGEGQNFIAELRNSSVYTEVIFYTAGNASDLWKDIYDKKLEGVFVSNRSAIMSKISKVGHQSIRKVLDLENMRGIVMAEVGELDHLLDRILTISVGDLSQDKQKSIFKKFYDGLFEQNQQKSERLTKFLASPEINEMLELCDSDNRWRNFVRVRKSHEKLNGKHGIGDYSLEVLKPRNFLAHGRPEMVDGGGCVFHYQGKEFYYDDDVSSQLRQTILRYKGAFIEILEDLAP